jgi:hypothetical protein
LFLQVHMKKGDVSDTSPFNALCYAIASLTDWH